MIKINDLDNIKSYIVPLFETANVKEELAEFSQKFGFDNWDLLADFKGNAKETLLWVGNHKVYFLGLGKKSNGQAITQVFRSFFYNFQAKFSGNVGIFLSKVSGLSAFAYEISNGIFLSQYRLGAQKTEKVQTKNWFDSQHNLSFISENIDLQALENGKALADTQRKIMTLVDAPANYKTPQMIAEVIQKIEGINVQVYDEKQCFEMGLHALLAVGKGSVENPARFVVMEYKHPKANKTIGLVGKGVTFDTGGVSLKPGDNMNYMKSDMGGAAAVIGTMEMGAKLNLPIHLVGVVCLTENCIDSLAIKPGDVIHSFAGKTIEVINTDAEGRLVLADGLAYINKTFKPDVMVDLATLTGNCIAALGYVAAALLTNNDKLADEIYESSQKTGEKTWRMPLWDDYKDMMKSDVADIKNLSSAPLAGAITAAKFLEVFTDKHPAWAHLDIAGVAFGDSEYGSMKSSTGYGVKLLIDWLRNNYAK